MNYFYTVLGSILVHLTIWWLLGVLPSSSQNEKEQAVEIVYSKPDTAAQKQIVRETKTEETDQEKNDRARFFSQNTRNVKEEMRARQSGLTQNRANSLPNKPTTQNQQSTGEKASSETPPKPNQIAKNFLPTPNMGGKPLQLPGSSTVGERLPEDVKMGDWTSLNTERYLYYTFFARVEERVRFRWETRVREIAENMDPRKLGRKEWITEIEIILNRLGHFEKAIVHKKSGIDELDQAAYNAFRNGAPFLNPPMEMIKDDGKFHLKYSISVSFSPYGRM
jgi:hypothetical protein